ncbi:hypothetical protein D9611_010746 [Ephemerocybe angulata]|uniref:Uncharacterized protein n=1 Tax=Ephemerocybe angulata TaxID=980116 RepID=A0A8H5F233_9AGAR|nr:hypothetical protein D9611_010746 [Tulosesus angulatus]
MKVTIPSILLGMLSLSTCAFAYMDYNELDARDYTDSLLVERNTVEVPFQHSLRSFLGAAADAHQRALDDHDDGLEAREETIRVRIRSSFNGRTIPGLMHGRTFVDVSKDWDADKVQAKLFKNSPANVKCTLHPGSFKSDAIPTLKDAKPNDLIVLKCATV